MNCPGEEIICPHCENKLPCHSCKNGIIYHCCNGKSFCLKCKQNYDCDHCKSLNGCNRCATLVNNQLGQLFDLLRFTEYYAPITYKHHDLISSVLISENVLDTKFAVMIRDFVQSIPCDNISSKTAPENAICTTIYDNLDKKNMECNLVLSGNITDSWHWESYGYGILRLYPETLDAFMMSSIYKLFHVLRHKFWVSTGHLDIKKYQPTTWVIQYMPLGTFIGAHSDRHGKRKLSFIYYLTPDDWDYTTDGGELIINDSPYKEIQSINNDITCGRTPIGNTISLNPDFNSMISWTIDQNADGDTQPLQASPIHYTGITKRRGRIALVGFYGN